LNAFFSLDLDNLQAAYAKGAITPVALIDLVYDRIAARGNDHVWIHLRPKQEVQADALDLMARLEQGAALPLFGIPFAIKDNLDVAGLPTTAACPEFAYISKDTAFAVQRCLDAGAILIGKTNLDQFATGLVGTRSPYGAPSCVFDSDYISGGSSSGSAVAVAAGLVSFALGTDTAGSGRVPAAFNNLVGWKPTRGLLSTRGLVPACRSLDCVSVFTLTSRDALVVMEQIAAYDDEDPFSRKPSEREPNLPANFRFGVPSEDQWEFFGDDAARVLYENALAQLQAIGGERVEIDYTPFEATAKLLYHGPWVAERLAAVKAFRTQHPDALHPVTESIIASGARFDAVAAFEASYELEALKRKVTREWACMDLLVLPTTGTIYTHAQLEADPIQLNTNLGRYTNFVNLLDLCGIALPAGFRSSGLPFGISLFAPAFHDRTLCELGVMWQDRTSGMLGGTPVPYSAKKGTPILNLQSQASDASVLLAVVGAHLTGQPLNHQLTELGAELDCTTRTAPDYQLYALAGTVPAKPGLKHDPGFQGPGIEVEVWKLGLEAFGRFVTKVPPPLAIGSLTLQDGTSVKGFVCEPNGFAGAEAITQWGGWRYWLASKRPPSVTH
jgi:allophanate hydrolase